MPKHSKFKFIHYSLVISNCQFTCQIPTTKVKNSKIRANLLIGIRSKMVKNLLIEFKFSNLLVEVADHLEVLFRRNAY